jgi:hypothetical protein
MRRHGIFATADYFWPRYHTFPAWSAVESPFAATAEMWEIVKAYQNGRSVAALRGARLMDDPDVLPWWPREHVHRAGRLLQLTQQVSLFRRKDQVLLAIATELRPDSLRTFEGTPLSGALIFSPAPGTFVFEQRSAAVGTVAAYRTLMKSVPQLVALELRESLASGLAVRTRFGVTPPPPISEMKPGEMALSDIAVLRPLEPGVGLPREAESVLDRMYGSTRLENIRSLGLYWETYGVSSTDTLHVAVRMMKLESRGILSRLLGRRPSESTVRWNDGMRGRGSVAVAPGATGRYVTLTLPSSAPGSWNIEVTMATASGRTASASRSIIIVK